MICFTVLSALIAVAGTPQKPVARSAHPIHLPKGYSIPEITRSPNGHYGVTVPDLDEYGATEEQNKLIDLRSGRILAVIHAQSGALHANHVEIERGNWSRDGTYFLWRVAGKWCPTALVLLRIRNGKVVWQVNLLDTAQDAILTRTKMARPHRYRAAVRANRGRGWDELNVDVRVNMKPGETLRLPLKVIAKLNSNPKVLEDYPKEAELDSDLNGIVSRRGKFKVTKFALNFTRKKERDSLLPAYPRQ